MEERAFIRAITRFRSGDQYLQPEHSADTVLKEQIRNIDKRPSCPTCLEFRILTHMFRRYIVSLIHLLDVERLNAERLNIE